MPGEGLTHGPPASKKAGGRYHRFSPINRHSLRNGFNGFLRALPGDRALLSPSPARCESIVARVMRSIITSTLQSIIDQLDASVGASEPHDFAVRFRAFRLARVS